MGNKVLVDSDLLDGLYALLDRLEGYDLDQTTQMLCKRLNELVTAKLDAQKRRQNFTAYKAAEPMGDKRKRARQKYLDEAGIHQDWRSDVEVG